MKQYDFYTSWGHGDFKTFVEDYWKQVQARGTNTNATAATAGAPAAKTATKSSAEVVFTGNHQ
jgi:hypothetical protein